MTKATLLAIDQGTTSSRAILFSAVGKILAVTQKELTLHYPQDGWVEQNPIDIWRDTLACCHAVLKGAENVAAIGITNQRETTILWDRKTGKPVHNAIVWQDRRTAPLCEKLKKAGHEKTIAARTGLLIDSYFSGTKIAWLLDNVKGLRKRAERGEIAFGTVDCWLLWNLTGGRVHATDATNASRTGVYNVRTNEWDEKLLRLLRIPRALLPAVKDNVADFGLTAPGLFHKQLRIGGMAGDQHAAMVGQACFDKGMVKSTYGTGCFALMNIGAKFRPSKHRLLTTIAYRLDGETTYALEGSIFIAGAAVQWLRDGLKVVKKASDTEKLAQSVRDSHGVYFVPAFTGLGAPYWRPHARASISGLTRDCTAAHIVRAALEAQGYQSADLMNAMNADIGRKPAVIRADGGLVSNKFVCQFIADMLDIPLEIPKVTEATALGAARLAGLQAGVYESLDEIAELWRRAHRYTPRMKPARRKTLYAGWLKAVASVIADD